MPERRVGWQPSRFLADRAEAERAFQLAQQLGSVNATATQLDTTWPSLRKAFIRHGLGMPAHNPEAVRQRTIAGAPAPQRPTGPTDHAAAGRGVCGAQPGPTPAPARQPTRAGRAATPLRGDRDAQLPHRRGVQPGEPARPRWAHRHHRRARRPRQAPGQRPRRAGRPPPRRAGRPHRPQQPNPPRPEERGILTDAREPHRTTVR
jgi:hypothetical protein